MCKGPVGLGANLTLGFMFYMLFGLRLQRYTIFKITALSEKCCGVFIFFPYFCNLKQNTMALFNFNKPEPREFNYKPRFYTPDDQKPTDDHRRDFANELHREWSSKRRHDKNDKHIPWLTIVTMLFFAVVLGIIFFKFFA